MKEFSGARLQQARETAGVSQTWLGYKLGSGEGAIRKYEKGEVVPGGNKVAALAHYLGVNLEDLYDEAGSSDARVARTDLGSEADRLRDSGTRRSSRRRRRGDER